LKSVRGEKALLTINFAQFIGFCPDIMFLAKVSGRIRVDWSHYAQIG
jgi:hypothetical protein